MDEDQPQSLDKQQTNLPSATQYYGLDSMDTDHTNNELFVNDLSKTPVHSTQINTDTPIHDPYCSAHPMGSTANLNSPSQPQFFANEALYPNLAPIEQTSSNNPNVHCDTFGTTIDLASLILNPIEDQYNLANIEFTPQEEALFNANFQQTNADPFFADSLLLSDADFEQLLRSLPTTNATTGKAITRAPGSFPPPLSTTSTPTQTPAPAPSTREIDRSICKYLHAIDAKASSIKEHANAVELLVMARVAHLGQGIEGSKKARYHLLHVKEARASLEVATLEMLKATRLGEL